MSGNLLFHGSDQFWEETFSEKSSESNEIAGDNEPP